MFDLFIGTETDSEAQRGRKKMKEKKNEKKKKIKRRGEEEKLHHTVFSLITFLREKQNM